MFDRIERRFDLMQTLGCDLLYPIDGKRRLGILWETDFEPVGSTEDDPSEGLTQVHHIAQSMHYEEMPTRLLIHTSPLDVTKTPVLDLVDPGGVVQSQVAQTRDEALRLVLNSLQSQRTLSARFLAEFFGSGVQHFAFATSERRQAAGLELLPISENYYDDLEAKTGLPGAEIDRMKRLGILYDRDGEAEYRQLYTRTLAEGFCFEIVERRNYRGFGGVNAPTRLAAQTRLAQRPSPRL